MRNKILLSIFFITFCGILFFGVEVISQEKTSGCITCHTEMGDELKIPVDLSKDDIHFQKGLGCQDCHGGNPNADSYDEAKDETFKGAPAKKEIPEFCGHCHSDAVYMKKYNPTLPTDQVEKFWTSFHGQALAAGDEKVANCVSCHSVHDIRPPSESKSTVNHFMVPEMCSKCHSDAEYMKEYGISTNQFEKYLTSVHGKALLEKKDNAAPACNDCHGHHAADRPDVSGLDHVCGRCHVLPFDLFEKSPHKAAYVEMGLPFCKSCHSDHDIQPVNNEMIGDIKPALCLDCHTADDGTAALETARFMRNSIEELESKQQEVTKVINLSERKGIDVEALQLRMRDIHQAIVSSKTQVHSFNKDTFENNSKEGFKNVQEVEGLAQKAIDEFSFRQRGYAIATLTLTLFCLFIYLKIRQVDREHLK